MRRNEPLLPRLVSYVGIAIGAAAAISGLGAAIGIVHLPFVIGLSVTFGCVFLPPSNSRSRVAVRTSCYDPRVSTIAALGIHAVDQGPSSEQFALAARVVASRRDRSRVRSHSLPAGCETTMLAPRVCDASTPWESRRSSRMVLCASPKPGP